MENLLDYYRELGVEVVRINEDEARGLYTVCYQHAGVDFNDPKIRMARGITLDSKGNIVLRGFQKFFNYLQLEDNDNYSEEFKAEFSRLQLTDKNQQIEVEEKLDGTMILLGIHNGELVVSTSSSTTNEYCVNALNYFNNLPQVEDIKEFLSLGLTLAFEYISPSNQVVVKYDKEDYVLLSCISNRSGLELGVESLRKLSKELNFTMFEVSQHTLDELIHIQRNGSGIEGFIIKNSFNKRIKFKIDEWFDFSKTYSIFYGNTSKRNIQDVLEIYTNDEQDDLIAFENQHTIFRHQGKASRIVKMLDDIFNEVSEIYSNYLKGKYDKRYIATELEPINGGVVIRLVLNRIKTNELNEKDGGNREEYTDVVKGRVALRIFQDMRRNYKLG